MNNTTTALAVAVVILTVVTLVAVGGGILTITPSAAFDMKKGKGGVEGGGPNGNTINGQQKGLRQLVCTPPSNNCVQEGLTYIDTQSPPRPTPTQLHVTQRIGPSKTITPGQVGVVAVTCNPGEIATGGGYTASANVIVASSLAGNSNTAWLVNAFNNSTQNGILAATAECVGLLP
jgi:hypothetical protein